MGLTVACVLRGGGEYNAAHVDGLQRQVSHFLPTARFVCLSDMPVRCERIPLETDWPGWWSKLELFREGLFEGPVLYLDLDTVIVKNPGALVSDRFSMIRNWKHEHLFASGVMAWSGDYSHIFRDFPRVRQRTIRTYVTCEKWGEQAFIAERAGKVHGFDHNHVRSYRFHCGTWGYPDDTHVVAFAGKHRPWSCGAPWAEMWWQ